MIYAKVDVELRDHVRAKRASVAMGTYLWGLLYSRGQELDGFVPAEMLSSCWAGEVQGLKHAAKLVEVGLWTAIDGGWTITNYLSKNDSKAVIDERKAIDRERKAKATREAAARKLQADSERKARADSERIPIGIPGTGLGTGPVSDPESRSEDPPQSPREVPPDPPSRPHNDAPACAQPSSLVELPDPSAAPPPWWDAVLGTIHAATGLELAAGECWIAYAGHRHGKARRAERNDALQWLTTVMVPKAREAIRIAARDRDRDATFAASRKPVAVPTPYAPAKDRPEPTEAEAAETRRLAAAQGLAFLDRTGTE